MGDREKLKTGGLGANKMEERELKKYMYRIQKQSDDIVSNLEYSQELTAKNFYQRLIKSAEIAKRHENMTLNFKSEKIKLEQNHCYFRAGKLDIQTRQVLLENRAKKANTNLEQAESEGWSYNPHLVAKVTERAKRADEGSESGSERSAPCEPPATKLKELNKNFRIPYKMEYSFRKGEIIRPSTVISMKCYMWRRVSDFFVAGRERAWSAPPWLASLHPPPHVTRAHERALQVVGIRKSMIEPPSRQPLIDVGGVQNWREKENKLARVAVKEFVATLKPFELKPGPSQVILDSRELYGMSAKHSEPLSRHNNGHSISAPAGL
ncbi:uncharacterized protein LOC116611711 [Nematostella vectensis]|uniref:uncharacterized protein LOC116611711 n=1 Tax=Nematostella vectensis TaxID=45351 RepID=UPI00138F9DE1|nr:uncharacterized protein LOC116611711 [Nematostella vectensis]